MENSRPFAPVEGWPAAGGFYALVSGEEVDRHGAPARTAWEIERLAALRGWPAGELLGSEAALRRRLGVSRETLREAIRIVEGRGAMKMRRGRAGGLTLSRPNVGRPAASLAAYLRAVRITGEEIAQCVRGLDQLLAWEFARNSRLLPCRRPGEGLRHWLARSSGRQTYMLYVAALEDLVDAAGIGQIAPNGLGDALSSGDAAEIFRLLAPLPFIGSREKRANDAGGLPARAVVIAVAMAQRAEANGAGALGNEASLCEEFDTSRAIIRQALRILQDLDMIEVRRGRGGGYALKQPSPIGVVRQLFAWLAARNCCPFALNELMWDLNAANLRLAGERLATKPRGERDAHCDALERIISELSGWERFIRLQQYLSGIAGCPMIDTLARCVVSYQARSYGELPITGRYPAFERAERRIVAALRGGRIDDAERTLRLMQDEVHERTLGYFGLAGAAE
jgi:DNA-binding FadR family transcriptional regulator